MKDVAQELSQPLLLYIRREHLGDHAKREPRVMTRPGHAELGPGVPFAVDPYGDAVEPEAAQHRKYFYKCLACREHVFLKAGTVRVAHFAHYAKREIPCSVETVLHEAAKLRLAQRLREGLTVIRVRQPCHGYISKYNHDQNCASAASTERELVVPDHDRADVEVRLGPYRLDAAAIRSHSVVLGLEVYQSNAVDATKQAYLNRSKIPWLELGARDVLYEPIPWKLLAGSISPYQCPVCVEEAASAARYRAQLEEHARHAELERKRQEQRDRFRERNFFVARQGRVPIRARSASPGSRATCLVCKQDLVATRIGKGVYWSHSNGYQCDPRMGWIRAGMLALYNQLKTAPVLIQIKRRCEGFRHGNCTNVLVDRLPPHDSIEGAGESLVLRQEGVPVAQIAFGKEYDDCSAPMVLSVRKPSKLLDEPCVLFQRLDGRYCASCVDKMHRVHAARIATQQDPQTTSGRGQLGVVLRRVGTPKSAKDPNLFSRGHSPEERDRALQTAREQLTTLGIDLWLAAGYSVTLRRCENCQQETVTVEPHGMRSIPIGLDPLLKTADSRILAKCAHCGNVAEVGPTNAGIPVSSARLPARH